MRSFLLNQYNDLPNFGFLESILGEKVPLRPIFYYGVFFEGIVSFHLALQMNGDEYQQKGEAALHFMRNWSKRNKWNFENKRMLLEAMSMYLSGYHEQASKLYDDSVRSSHEHKFTHEEAICAELGATFYYESGDHSKAYAFFLHAVKCYKKWSAFAVAARVESVIEDKFGLGFEQMQTTADSVMESVLAPRTVSSTRKRQE